MTPLRDKRGRLTAYALACGYIERAGTFELSAFAGSTLYRVWDGTDSDGQVFHTLESARVAMRRLARQEARQ